ncbi:MAG: hypothetical protein ABSC51_01960 [Gaiellaceae bacterium]
MVAAVGLLSAGAAALPTVKIPHANYTIYTYNAKVSIKGGTTLSNAYNSPSGSVGDVQNESSTTSFSVDGTIKFIIFYKGGFPKGTPGTLEPGAASAVNGTWSDQGAKWAPPDGKTTEPFTCNGTIASTTGSGNTILKLTRSTGAVKAVLRVLTDQIENVPPMTCPDATRAESLGAVGPEVYQTNFTIPKSKIGKKTFSMNVSGPLTKYRSFLKVVCEGNPGGCTYNMAWHGVVRFTRTRTIKIKY